MPANSNFETALKHFRGNNLQAAESELRALIEAEPENYSAKTLLAAVSLKLGRPDEARALSSNVLEAQPNNADALGILALLNKRQRNFAAARHYFDRLLKLGPPTPQLLNEIGLCCLEMGDYTAAVGAFMKAIDLDRGQGQSYYNLGLALKMAGNSLETYQTFKRAIQVDPDLQDAYVQLWQQMRQPAHLKEGIPILEQGLKRHHDSPDLMAVLALAYGKDGRPSQAEALFKRAISLDDGVTAAYAHWLQEEGRFEDSVAVLREAIQKNPHQGQAYYSLAIAKGFEVAGAPLETLIPPILKLDSLDPEGRMFLHMALAKTFDQKKNYESAMGSYYEANNLAYNLYNSHIRHNQEAVEAEQQILARLYPRKVVEDLRRHGSESEVPVFIVGMIRTGTTLLDQILSTHPDIKSAGEQPFWSVRAGRVSRLWATSGPNVEQIKELERDYLAVLQSVTGGAKKITDKMPTNFSHLGLMSIAFPKAKFIHLRRSPLDTCLSIYTTFLGTGTRFAYSQDNIVGYYYAYLRTMEHWRSVFSPEQLLEIDYEELVTDKESTLRKVIDFIGLPWNEAILSHEQNASQVSTPSLYTARQPVNTASVERWRRYEPWLGKLLDLKDVKHPPKLS